MENYKHQSYSEQWLWSIAKRDQTRRSRQKTPLSTISCSIKFVKSGFRFRIVLNVFRVLHVYEGLLSFESRRMLKR